MRRADVRPPLPMLLLTTDTERWAPSLGVDFPIKSGASYRLPDGQGEPRTADGQEDGHGGTPGTTTESVIAMLGSFPDVGAAREPASVR